MGRYYRLIRREAINSSDATAPLGLEKAAVTRTPSLQRIKCVAPLELFLLLCSFFSFLGFFLSHDELLWVGLGIYRSTGGVAPAYCSWQWLRGQRCAVLPWHSVTIKGEEQHGGSNEWLSSAGK